MRVSLRLLFTGLAVSLATAPIFGQISETSTNTPQTSPFFSAILNADNNPAVGALRGDDFHGLFDRASVSVQELSHPLTTKHQNLLVDAQKKLASGNTAAGLSQLRQAAQDPAIEPYALSILGSEHLKRGENAAAYEELSAAVRLMPGLAANHANLAIVLRMRGENEQALKEAQKALQLEPGKPGVRLIMAKILLLLGRKEEAKFHLLRATEIPAARALLAQTFGQ
jgi:tetratricopeptide (TPR) repeat protein